MIPFGYIGLSVYIGVSVDYLCMCICMEFVCLWIYFELSVRVLNPLENSGMMTTVLLVRWRDASISTYT